MKPNTWRKTNTGLPHMIALVVGFMMLVPRVSAENKPLPVVATVDFARYAGTWYEIARLPNRFQDHCTGKVSAKYAILPDGRISVVNSCRTKDGTTDTAEGVAKLAAEKGPKSKLKVRFAPSYLSFLPFVWGDYWIFALADDYSYALVGDPSRKYMWILSRTPTIDESLYGKLVAQAKQSGFAVERLIRTRQE